LCLTLSQTDEIGGDQINVRGLKIAYSDSEGLPVAYLFHKKILRRSLNEARGELSEKEVEEEANNTSRRASDRDIRMLAYREELLKWLVDLVRSPLPTAAIHWYSRSYSL
jgi:hypothetical protein